MTRPTFTEPNLLCVQILYNGSWDDYASIKTQADLEDACRLVETKSGYRIVRFRAGTTVVYPN